MVMFCSDLDNTLIYSSRHLSDMQRNTEIEKLCVEKIGDREVSYITRQTLWQLNDLQKKVLFVPVTTRSIEQYRRIHLPMPVKTPSYALVCNGGVLLKDGESDAQWYRESVEMMEESREELDKGQVILEEDRDRILEVRRIEDLFLFTKSELPERATKRLKAELNQEKTEVFSLGSKVYVLPKALNKGRAVERLKKKLKADCVFAAGDSMFDLPMLETADFSAAPAKLKELAEEPLELSGKIKRNQIVFLEGEIFSDVMVEYFFNHMAIAF